MTYNEIICALDRLKYGSHTYSDSVTAKNAIDLIIRQKAEIESFQNERIERIRELTRLIYDKEIAEARANAIKEFAERLKENSADIVLYGEIIPICRVEILVKEMKEKSENED